MISWFVSHLFLFANFFFIIGEIVCKTVSILEAGVELEILNIHWCIYCI